MKVTSILNQVVLKVTPEMHKVRRQSLSALIASSLSSAHLSVTDLGRNIVSDTSEKHQIKRSDRLCSNIHLQQSIVNMYHELTQLTLSTQKRPVILVDWSDLDSRKVHFLLRASVAIKGRSLTLYEEVHPLIRREKRLTHQRFLERLKSMLGNDSRPIIVTDAGFRVPWFKLVKSLGWDYVGRARNRTFCQQQDKNDWQPVKSLYRQANAHAKNLGIYYMARRNPIECSLIVYKKAPLSRKDWSTSSQRVRTNSRSRKCAERESEPWLLATSLASKHQSFAQKIVRIYRTRMQRSG